MDLQWGIILQIIQRVCVDLFLLTNNKMCYLPMHHILSYECLCCSAMHPTRHVQILMILRAVVTGWKVQFWVSNYWGWLRSCAVWDTVLPFLPRLQVTTAGRLSVWFSLSTITMVKTHTHQQIFFLSRKVPFWWIFAKLFNHHFYLFLLAQSLW